MGRVEQFALAKLRQRGWTIIGADRKGLDLDLHVSFEGARGKVRLPLSAPFRDNPYRLTGGSLAALQPYHSLVSSGQTLPDRPSRSALTSPPRF